MILIALAFMVLGVLCGQFWLDLPVETVDLSAKIALCVLVFSVGLDIGHNREIFAHLKKMNIKVLLIPLGIVVGSLGGGVLVGMAFGFPFSIAGGISSGFGWYSLSAIMLNEMVSPQVGTISFLVNVFREIMAILLIPLLAKYLNVYTAIAPAGATSMDTTLSFIKKYTNEEVAVIAVVNGVLLSALVPVFVTLFCGA